MAKLEMGGGDSPHKIGEDWVHLDINPHPLVEIVSDCRRIPKPAESYDELYSSHLFEHFDINESEAIIREWHRVLTRKGLCVIVIPDVGKVARCIANSALDVKQHEYAMRIIYGYPPQLHFFGYTKNLLAHVCTRVKYPMSELPLFKIVEWSEPENGHSYASMAALGFNMNTAIHLEKQ